MVQNITIVTDQYGKETEEQIRAEAASQLGVEQQRISAVLLIKKSIDARRGKLKVNLRYAVYVDEQPPAVSVKPLVLKQADPSKSVIIIGSGPAGLFAALKLLESGIKPIILERGPDVTARKRDIAMISREQRVNPDSNYCFGEGGAGTYSDGKLYTRSKKRGEISSVTGVLYEHGADERILTDAHPHIGTDKLGDIVQKIRERIISCGGEVHFSTQVMGITKDIHKNVTGVITDEGIGFPAKAIIAATGHSAGEFYEMLQSAGVTIEAKPFAVGVRVEHPRTLIDSIQYHGMNPGTLGAATYTLKAQVGERGVYSFCMCPGGIVVPSATDDDQIAVNGMSPSGRNTRWSNAAFVVEVTPDDIPAEFGGPADPLCGLRYQRFLEHEAKEQGKGQKAPAQRMTDFVSHMPSRKLPETSYAPGVVASRLDLWIPGHITKRLIKAFRFFDTRMHGFLSDKAVLIAIETRTSSPVRITRDPQTLEVLGIGGLYAAGEGSGYAGGIVSSAMDGQAIASAVAARLLQ